MLALVFTLAAPVSAAKGDRPTVCLIGDNIVSGDFIEYSGLLSGLEKAEKKLKVNTEVFLADDQTQFIPALEEFTAPGACDLIIGAGFMVGIEMVPFIETNPDQAFTILDFEYFPKYENVSEVLFRVDQAAFLAGYLAAGLSQTGKVGVYGGIQFNRVTEFMDGYALGAAYYNDQHGTAVEVLGWDPWIQDGLFVGNFWDMDLAKDITQDLFEAGADTVFAVAGGLGFGSLEVAVEWKAAGEDVRVIQPDFDWSAAYGDPDRLLLTSVLKEYDEAVYHAVEAFVNGSWEGGQIWEDLASEGVDIARFHKTNNQVPGYLKNDLKAIRLGIMEGSIPTMP